MQCFICEILRASYIIYNDCEFFECQVSDAFVSVPEFAFLSGLNF